MTSLVTVDQAAALAGCTARSFGARAKAMGVDPIHYTRIDGRLRPVYTKDQAILVLSGGPGSQLAFDKVAVDLDVDPASLAEIVLSHSPGGSLAVPHRYRVERRP